MMAALLLLALGGRADAQSAGATMRIPDLSRDKPRAGTLRALVCRGAPQLRLEREAVPSPRDRHAIAVALRYGRSGRPAGADYAQLEPGTCTWNPSGDRGVPQEPGVVHFDVAREGSAEVPEQRTLTRWLEDPQHLWLFYTDDLTNVSISHGAYGARFWAGSKRRDKAPASSTGLARRAELRCRGGSGLAFARGGSAGANLVGMALSYQLAPAEAGATGSGLSAGTCAWVDRDSIRGEPGRIAFVTAGNAQLKQIQSGAGVDRSTTAAERWPDAQTIPVYLADPAHYWSFTVQLSNSDSALRHAAWKPAPADIALSSPPTDGSVPSATTAAGSPPDPGSGSPLAGERTPGAGTSLAFDAEAIRGVTVTPSIAGVEMRFQGGERLPLVQISLEAPVREPSSGRWFFAGEKQNLQVSGSDGGAPRDYSAVTTGPLTRGTEYHYLINAPEGVGVVLGRRRLPTPDHQAVGTFHTLRTTVKVRFDRVHVIDDSDDGSDGDLAFAFEIDEQSVLEMGTGLAERSTGTLLDWESGETHDLNELLEAPTDQDLLRLQVSGFDNDATIGTGTLQKGWGARPGGDDTGDWNQARAEYHLDQYPSAAFDFPFEMRTGPGSTLQFEVEGRVFVTRE